MWAISAGVEKETKRGVSVALHRLEREWCSDRIKILGDMLIMASGLRVNCNFDFVERILNM
jgi:hypothetical protein